jgi:hypothetical protein
MRVLPTHNIPKELYSDDNTLFLPASLVIAYRHLLDGMGKLQEAINGTEDKNIHGGISKEETVNHFVYRFIVSSGRMEYSCLAPSDDFSEISDALLSTFSDGHIGYLDLACGTGAACGTLLATISSLRQRSCLPKLPLTVSIFCADYSKDALSICSQMLESIKPDLDSQGIKIDFLVMEWDATRGDHAAKIMDEWFLFADGASEYVMGISNFSGALIKGKLLEHFEPCLENMLSRLHDKKSTFFWIEPNTNDVSTSLFPRVVEFFSNRIPWFNKKKECVYVSKYKLSDPLSKKQFPSGVQIDKFVRC